MRKNLDMSLLEYVKFQEIKSLAYACGKLTFDEAVTIYTYLGNTVDAYNNQPLEVKLTLTNIFVELIKPQ